MFTRINDLAQYLHGLDLSQTSASPHPPEKFVRVGPPAAVEPPSQPHLPQAGAVQITSATPNSEGRAPTLAGYLCP